MIQIYTDGAASGNPGPGGYGVILRAGAHYKELSGGFRMTTNNRMELLAVIEGLKAIKKPGQQVTIYSDSKYVVDSVEKGWVFGWVKKGFQGKKNKDFGSNTWPYISYIRSNSFGSKVITTTPKTNVATAWP